jgi:hypothetical protein
MVDDQAVYVQALETVRSTTNQVVSTGGFFVIGYVTAVGISFTNRSSLLLGAASIFMLALWALLRRWQVIMWNSLSVAERLEPKSAALAASLRSWVGGNGERFYRRAQWKVNAPLLVALITLAAAGVVAATVDSWSAAGNPT